MSEMSERVTKAKWARRQEVGRKFGIEPPLADWDDELESLREEVRAETRAGFEAMREPTEAMASHPMATCYNPGPYGDKEVRRIWRSMINAALTSNTAEPA